MYLHYKKPLWPNAKDKGYNGHVAGESIRFEFGETQQVDDAVGSYLKGLGKDCFVEVDEKAAKKLQAEALKTETENRQAAPEVR